MLVQVSYRQLHLYGVPTSSCLPSLVVSDLEHPTQSSVEAPNPLSSVVPSAVINNQPLVSPFCHPSHPDTESSACNGGFQAAYHGKHSMTNSDSYPDDPSPSRAARVERPASPASPDFLTYYQNFVGIFNSLAEYRLTISDSFYDVYPLTETWLNENKLPNQLFI